LIERNLLVEYHFQAVHRYIFVYLFHYFESFTHFLNKSCRFRWNGNNLDDDLGEKNDLAPSRRDIVTALQEELAVWERGLD